MLRVKGYGRLLGRRRPLTKQVGGMNVKNVKKIILFAVVVLMLGLFVFAEGVANPDTLIEETIGTIPSLDPAWCYDTASVEAVSQMYDNLIQYDATSLTKYLPMISTNVPSVADGTILDNGKTYVFHIRKGVKFHNGDVLTPQDVKYSFERLLVLDRSGGAAWMIAEALFPTINGNYVDSITQWAEKFAGVKWKEMFNENGTLKSQYEDAIVKTFELMDKDFEIKGNTLIIHLPHPYPPFLSMIAHYAGWTSIEDKKWAVENGAWPGTAKDWWKYNNPTREKDPLYSIENGSGPFMLERWSRGREIVFKRFDDYWNTPAKIKYAVIRRVSEFTTRKLDLQRGNADIIYVPEQYMAQVEKMSGVRVLKGFPTLEIVSGFFNFNVNAKGKSLIGSGKLDGNGVPPDFFSDINVRKAFEYLFPYEKYINEVWNGEGMIPNSCIPKGLLGYSEDVPSYNYNLEKATEYFKKAYNGELWKKGFKFTIVYNTGNQQRRLACEMIKFYARKINPKFQINVVSELWASYLDDVFAGRLPFFVMGWTADYPDAYDFAQPFLSSFGTYGAFLGKNFRKLAQKEFNPLIVASMKTSVPEERAKIYKELATRAHNYAVELYMIQPYGHHVERTWVKGWYYNPMSLMAGLDFYKLSK